MKKERLTGFVIGCDIIGKKKVWKIRIKDTSSEINGKKLSVASIHNDITLAQGLEVTFIVGTFQEKGQKIFKATDVQVQTEQRKNIMKKNNDPTLNIVVSKIDNKYKLWFTGFENKEEILQEYFRDEPEDFIMLLPFKIAEQNSLEDITEGFNVILAQSTIEPIRDAMEEMLTAVFCLALSVAKKMKD